MWDADVPVLPAEVHAAAVLSLAPCDVTQHRARVARAARVTDGRARALIEREVHDEALHILGLGERRREQNRAGADRQRHGEADRPGRPRL